MGRETQDKQVSRESLEAFLATAPVELKGWASDALAAFDSQRGEGTSQTRQSAGAAEEGAADPEDLLPDYEDPVSNERRTVPKPGASGLQRRTGVSKLNLVLVALLSAAIIIIVQMWGRPAPQQTGLPQTMTMPSGHPSIDPSLMEELIDRVPQLDTAQETKLKQQLEDNPSDIASRMQLAGMYFESARYDQSAVMLEEILALDPNNTDAMLNLGAVRYKQGRFDESEQLLLKSIELNPKMPEPWYDLGFVYMARTPADIEKAKLAWNKVIELAPESEMATEVKGYLSNLASATASPEDSPQPEPSPSEG